MSHELHIIPGTRIAFFCWSGPITYKDRQNNRDMIVQFCKENGISKVIVDTRKQENKSSTVELFEFGSSFQWFTHPLRFAIVRNSPDEDIRFAENVAVNRGCLVFASDTVEEARKWLEEQDPKDGPPEDP